MEKKEFTLRVIGRKDDKPLSLENFTLKEQIRLLEIAKDLCSIEGCNANELVPRFEDGSWKLVITGAFVAISSVLTTFEKIFEDYNISEVNPKIRKGLIELQKFCTSNNFRTQFSDTKKVVGEVDASTVFNNSNSFQISDSTILIGILDILGWSKDPKIVIIDSQDKKSISIHSDLEYIKSISHLFNEEVSAEVTFKRNFRTNQIISDSYKLVSLKKYNLHRAYQEILELQNHFDFSFLGDKDAVDYVRELRGKND